VCGGDWEGEGIFFWVEGMQVSFGVERVEGTVEMRECMSDNSVIFSTAADAIQSQQIIILSEDRRIQ
jgi:hypothetical protein